MSISSDPDADLSFISPCNHEEADTRVFLHTKDMTLKGHKSILIRTVDTDVLVLSLESFFHLVEEIDQFWIDFGTGKNRKFFAVHEIFDVLRTKKAQSIPFFNALTGCDQVSFLSHVTKKSAWKVWSFFEEITPIFKKLGNQSTIEDVKESLPAIERFTVLLCHRSSNCVTTNDCRRDLFCQGRSIDNITPSSSALWKHLLCSSYVAGYIWGQSMISHQALPDVEEWPKLENLGLIYSLQSSFYNFLEVPLRLINFCHIMTKSLLDNVVILCEISYCVIKCCDIDTL